MIRSVMIPICFLVTILAVGSFSIAKEEQDSAFRDSSNSELNDLIPGRYPQSEWKGRYTQDVVKYVDAHPGSPHSPRLCFDLYLVAIELNDKELISDE